MNIENYRDGLNRFEEGTASNLTALKEWTVNEALPWLWKELGGTILKPKKKHEKATTSPKQPTLKPMNDAEAVRHGLIVSVTDFDKKVLEPSYYRAQLTMLDAEAKKYCRAIANFSNTESPFAAEATIHTLHRALLENMRYAMVLLEDAARHVAEVPGYFGAFRSKHEHPFEVFQGARQIVYGTFSTLAYMDRAPYIPVAVLRTAVELRLRHAFGIYGLLDLDNSENLEPIALSNLFIAIQKQQSDIEFAVDVHDVWKIYRWSNFYLHGGYRDFPWVVGFLLQYLAPLFANQQVEENGSWSIDGGIRMHRQTWRSVRMQLQPRKLGLIGRLSKAWRLLVQGNKRQLELPVFDEGNAQCKFID